MIRRWRTLALLGAAACPIRANAQIASGGDSGLFRSDAAGVRVEPQYQIKPLPIGPLQATISVAARSVSDSNIFRTTNGQRSDVYFELTPSIAILAGFGAHNATLSVRASARRYARLTRENRETINVTYGGRISFDPRSSATWRTSYARETEQRGAAGSNVQLAGPAQFQLLQSNWNASTEIGRLAVSASAGIVQRSYKPLALTNGAALDQSFRDTQTIRIAPRASFSAGSSEAIFVGGSASRTISVDRSLGALRDASGYTLLTGIRSETNGLLIGEIGVGWRGQNYRNPLFSDYSGFTYDATVDWYPTRLVSVRVQAGQDIVNSGLVAVAGIVRQTLGATAYYDPLRNVRFIVAIDRDHDAFRELNFSTNTVSATLTGRYQLGRHLDLSAYGRIQSKESSNSLRAEGYDSLAIGFAVTGVL